jgi:hypothetical protein
MQSLTATVKALTTTAVSAPTAEAVITTARKVFLFIHGGDRDAARYALREVASGQAVRVSESNQPRRFLGAARLGVAAAGVEVAARWWIPGAGNLAFQYDVRSLVA